jgi:hypothetical protein
MGRWPDHRQRDAVSQTDATRETYLEDGRRVMAMVADIQAELVASAGTRP